MPACKAITMKRKDSRKGEGEDTRSRDSSVHCETSEVRNLYAENCEADDTVSKRLSLPVRTKGIGGQVDGFLSERGARVPRAEAIINPVA